MGQRTEQDQAKAVISMRFFATGLLILVTTIFIVSLKIAESGPWSQLLRAFSEAAMVGALADWFAVTALFRRPLGLPIPHTAIIPMNKERIGNNFGTFVEKNFLSPEIIEKKLLSIDIASCTANWFSKEENARFALDKFANIIPPILETISEKEVNEILYEGMKSQLESTEISPLLGKLLKIVLAGDRNRILSNEALNILGQLVEENKLLIRKKIKEESPWFIPDFVDNKIYEKIITQLRALILEIKGDPNHEVRTKFSNKVSEFVSGLSSNSEYREIGEIIKNELLNSEPVKDAFYSFCRDLKASFETNLADSNSVFRSKLNGIVSNVAIVISGDEALRRKINNWIRLGALAILSQHSHQIADLISDTVRNWDSSTLVDKFELEIGRDLQFIRINGTIVGGLIGVLIFVAEQYLHS